MAARGLATGKTFTVGLIVPDLLQPFFAHFAKELGGVLRQHDRALLLASSEEDPKIEAQEIFGTDTTRSGRIGARLVSRRASPCSRA
jgi:DNA-binding LacI/PurR family transcriptional regulator